ncbi:MAG: TlpA disulfide reductase family protein [Dehalococcoidia bacterium]
MGTALEKGELKPNPFLVSNLLFALLAMLFLSSCGGPAPESSGPLAPDFTVQTMDGSSFTLSQHRGKVVILFAMAAWCPTCVPETQALAHIYQEYRDRGVEVLILDVWPGETERQLLRFKSSAQGGDHFWAMDTESRWALAYEIRTLDTTVIVDRQGRIAYRDGSPTPYQRLKEEIERLL